MSIIEAGVNANYVGLLSQHRARKEICAQDSPGGSCHDPISIAYYQRKRADGKKHNDAIIRLERRRCDVLYSMIKNGTLYEEKTAVAV